MFKGKLKQDRYGDYYVSYYSDDLDPLTLDVNTYEHLVPVWNNDPINYTIGEAVQYDVIENQKLSGIVRYAKLRQLITI